MKMQYDFKLKIMYMMSIVKHFLIVIFFGNYFSNYVKTCKIAFLKYQMHNVHRIIVIYWPSQYKSKKVNKLDRHCISLNFKKNIEIVP